MGIIEKIIDNAKLSKKRIVLPESMDERVISAAKIIKEKNIADIILIGDINDDELNGIEIINPNTSELTEKLVEDLYNLRKEKGLTLEDARNLLLKDYMYYACMLVKDGYADGVVSGACHSTANTLRPALQIIKTKQNVEFVSSFFLMDVPNCKYGVDGVFVFSDCGLEQNPTAEKLATIAGTSAESFKLLTNIEPNVALLSHSTLGSAKHNDVDKVVEATAIAKSKYPQFNIDGELQLDAAIIPEVASSKASSSSVAGKANVLIFPDLDAGNIGYKLVQRLANAEAYGPITQGIAAPINDLSRGCSVDDIVGVVAITSLQVEK